MINPNVYFVIIKPKPRKKNNAQVRRFLSEN